MFKKNMTSTEIMLNMVIMISLIAIIILIRSDSLLKSKLELTTNQMESYISQVEEVGYLDMSTKANIVGELSQNYSKVAVEGTQEIVEKGKQVDLIIKVSDTNGYGQDINNKTFVKKGIAK